MDDIKLCKIVTGELVIGKLDYTDFLIKDVYVVRLHNVTINETGVNFQAELLPYMFPISDQPTSLNMDTVLTKVNPPKDILSRYSTALSGIILPSLKLV